MNRFGWRDEDIARFQGSAHEARESPPSAWGEQMISFVETAWNLLDRVLPSIIKGVRKPIRCTVVCLAYEDLSTQPGDSVVVITPHPWRYYARLRCTNRSDRVVYVDDVRLRMAQDAIPAAETQEAVRFEPHEPKELVLVFPISSTDAPIRAGPFSIEIAPTVGRTTVVRGVFPVDE